MAMPNQCLKAVVFDMDNTLFDLVEAQLLACAAVTEELNSGSRYDLYAYFIREPSRYEDASIIKEYQDDRGISAAGFSELCALYDQVKLSAISPYPGVKEALAALRERGVKLGVATNSVRSNTLIRLEKTGLAQYFDVIITADMVDRAKPSPDSIVMALGSMGVAAEDALMVGDSLGRDLRPADWLGMATAYAKYGDRNLKGELPGFEADYTLNSAAEILDVVGL